MILNYYLPRVSALSTQRWGYQAARTQPSPKPVSGWGENRWWRRSLNGDEIPPKSSWSIQVALRSASVLKEKCRTQAKLFVLEVIHKNVNVWLSVTFFNFFLHWNIQWNTNKDDWQRTWPWAGRNSCACCCSISTSAAACWNCCGHNLFHNAILRFSVKVLQSW